MKLLRERGVIADERLTMVYLVLSRNRTALRAGEYFSTDRSRLMK